MSRPQERAVGAVIFVMMLGADRAGGSRALADRARWPTAVGVALFPVTYLFLVVFAWYGPYNTLCELRDAPIVGAGEGVVHREHVDVGAGAEGHAIEGGGAERGVRAREGERDRERGARRDRLRRRFRARQKPEPEHSARPGVRIGEEAPGEMKPFLTSVLPLLRRGLPLGALALALLVGPARAGAESVAPAAAPAPAAAGDPIPTLERALAYVQARLGSGNDGSGNNGAGNDGAGAAAAYHVAYALTERRAVTLQGTHGATAGVARDHDRMADVDVRVGSMALDNTHKIRDASWWSEESRPTLIAPLTDTGTALYELLLRGTDDLYRAARRRLIKVRANTAVKVEREDLSDDFSAAPKVVDIGALPPLAIDEEKWGAWVKDASALYLRYPSVHDSAVQIVASDNRRWLATNEGTRIADGRYHLRVATWATTTADDGMKLQVYDYVDVASVDHLPDRTKLLAMVQGAAERLTELRSAPLVEPYAGPAILRGRAAGVFFHEIFGHRIEGHRQKDEDEGQTFTSRVGQPILPAFLSVVDDPTLSHLGDIDLNGAYRYDDEGVPAQRVTLVEKGILRNFLLSRSPIANFPTSNGHGRRQPGNAVVARQGNLMVEAAQTIPYAALRARLLDEVRKQGKPFGLVFDDISGGFTFTGRAEVNAFSVQPVTVWKVFPDGRPDQLVRGVDLIGTPLTTFARIMAAADDRDVFNGMCGAESGWVPVSASSPSLLVGEVEVQRHEKENDRPPLLVAPVVPAAPTSAPVGTR
jgi:predicted Zn-dependent protease